ncbi:membrane protein insertion efficiency factor YidD [Candidatus Peregrinibacteria bacterium]|nr:membrane protein insertion efficiency factor YidD [Candidatus Peregrinibacteria bacterium]
MPRTILAKLISLYQLTLSPDHGFLRHIYPGGYCKFVPSCSEYAKQSIKKHGVIKGFIKGFLRVLKCNPWSKGGVDQP